MNIRLFPIFFLCGFCLSVLPINSSAQNFYYGMNVGVSLGFTHNHGVGITSTKHKSDPSIGLGYQSELLVGKSFSKSPISVELGIGTYDMSATMNPYILRSRLGKKEFTFHNKFLSAGLKLGYKLQLPYRKISVELVAGSNFIFNRVSINNDDSWQYPETSEWYNSDGIVLARYKSEESYNTTYAFLFHGGFRLNYQLSGRLHILGMFFYEKAFTSIRSVLYTSEITYPFSQPLITTQMLSVFSGDALGLKIGVRYSLNR